MAWGDDPRDMVDDAYTAAGRYSPNLAQQIRTGLLEAASRDLDVAVEMARDVIQGTSYGDWWAAHEREEGAHARS